MQGERVLAETAQPSARGAGTSARANAFRSLAAVHAALGAPAAARRAYDNAAAAYRAVEHWYQVGNTLGLQLYEVALPYAADDLAGRRRLADGAAAAWARASEALADLPPRIAHLPLLLLEGEWDEARERSPWRCARPDTAPSGDHSPPASSPDWRTSRAMHALAWSLVRGTAAGRADD